MPRVENHNRGDVDKAAIFRINRVQMDFNSNHVGRLFDETYGFSIPPESTHTWKVSNL